MPTCEKCNNKFPNLMKINGIQRNLSSRKYCLDCSPSGLHNTSKLNGLPTKKQVNQLLQYGDSEKYCKQCGKMLNDIRKIYCDTYCQHEFQYQDYIRKWKSYEVRGTKGKHGQLSGYVRRYIFEKFKSKCVKCGWSEINPYTNTIPLEINHIDGNWKNSYESNLELVCPNCHSLTSTYRGANRGHGRDITWIKKAS